VSHAQFTRSRAVPFFAGDVSFPGDVKHVDGILNYCRTKVRFGVVEAVIGNIRMLINHGRGYQNLRYLLLKAKRMAVANIEFIAVHTLKKAA
jgi:hypothetical protein